MSGKSTYLKQIALCQIMAQIGKLHFCFIVASCGSLKRTNTTGSCLVRNLAYNSCAISAVGGAVWEELGNVTLLEKVSLRGLVVY